LSAATASLVTGPVGIRWERRIRAPMRPLSIASSPIGALGTLSSEIVLTHLSLRVNVICGAGALVVHRVVLVRKRTVLHSSFCVGV